MEPVSRRLLVPAAPLLLLLALGAGAALPAPTNVVDAASPFVVRALTPGGPEAACFVDADGNGVRGAPEPAYLAVACATVAAGDVRLLAPATGGRGSQVRAGDSDLGRPLTGLGAILHADLDSDGAFRAPDLAAIDADGSGDLSAGDVLLDGGPRAAPRGQPAPGHAYTALLHTGFFDLDGDGSHAPGEPVYLDADGDLFASAGDLVLSGPRIGRAILAGDPEAVTRLAPGGPEALCFRDLDLDGVADPAEALYLAFACGAVQPGDVRLSTRFGSQVRAFDREAGQETAAVGVGLAFLDSDGDALPGPGESLWADLDGSGTVSPPDRRLSAPGAGRLAGTRDPLLGSVLSPGAGPVMFIDGDRDGGYGPGDTALLAPAWGEYLSVGNVFLSGPRAGQVQLASSPGTVGALALPLALEPCFLDGDGDGALGPQEALYLSGPGCAQVGALDVQLWPFPRQVRGSHPSFGAPLAPAGAVGFVDLEGDRAFSVREKGLVLDVDGSGTASAGDRLLSGPSPGIRLTAAGGELALVPATGVFAALDLDGDGIYTFGDAVYYDDPSWLGHGEGFVTPGDVRFI